MKALAQHADLLCDAALALIYPQSCNVCGASVESRHDGVACRSCWANTNVFSPETRLCSKCGVPSPGADPNANTGVSCHRCDGSQFTAARACGVYENALRSSVIALKTQASVCRRLATLMVNQCRRPPLQSATSIIPVPLHSDREVERGFNQAAVLARVLSKRLRLPLLDQTLARVAHTERHRAGMDAKARRDSVNKAFRVIQPRLVAAEIVLLVDDVFTTGATVSACAEVLIAAGAKEVLVLTIARPLQT